MDKKIVNTFECRKELNSMAEPPYIEMYSFYNKIGKYIGDIKNFEYLVIEKGIEPETFRDNKVCSIGKSSKDGKWYGWSHRALNGFSIGDEVKKGHCCASSGWTDEYLKDHPDPYILKVGFKAESEEDCKKMAKAFASSVS